ncbi:MAG: DUF6632 domain-containing protein [Candidatus Korobacteraceae bacterium]|jgi:site-specific recombinase XerD
MFFRYCTKHKWSGENVAADLSRIKIEPTETLPLSREQFAAALKAAAEYHPRGKESAWRRQRATAMLLLCRHSGLRISDAARLQRSKLLPNDALFLRTTKTGQPVYVLLPSASRSVIAFTAWSSFAHAALMGTQACRNMVARGELIGVAVLVIIGVVLIALAPPKQLLESASRPGQFHSR